MSFMTESNQTCACKEGFYCKNGTNVCSPECEYWVTNPRIDSNRALDVIVIVANSIGLLSGMLVLLISGLRWKKM